MDDDAFLSAAKGSFSLYVLLNRAKEPKLILQIQTQTVLQLGTNYWLKYVSFMASDSDMYLQLLTPNSG